MTARSSISSKERPREFMAKALRSMWGPGAGTRPGRDEKPARVREPGSPETATTK